MTVRRVVLAEHLHRADDLDTGRVHRHQDLRLALVRRRVGVGLHHHDQDLAARVAGAGRSVLLAVDDPLVAVAHAHGTASFLASDDATSGSVITYAERISPRSSGSSHRCFCSGVPTRSSTSMLPVSGAEQLRHSEAIGFLPSSTAM